MFAHQLHLKSVDEFVNLKPSAANAKQFEETVKEHFLYGGGKSWFGAATEAEIRTIVGIGWPEGVERARLEIGNITMSRSQAQSLSKVRMEKKYGPGGDNFDPDRAHDEDASPWYSWVKESGAGNQGQHVRIRVATEAAYYYGANSLFFRGAAACMMADALEESGRSVEIVAYILTDRSYHSKQGKCFVTFPLKRAGEPLDLNRIAAMTAFAGAFRFFGFQAIASGESPVSYNWGEVCYADKLPAFPDDDGIHTIDIRNVWDINGAKKWLENEAARLLSGGPSEEDKLAAEEDASASDEEESETDDESDMSDEE